MTTRKRYFKSSFRPNFKKEKQFCDGAIAIEKEKQGINLNKQIYIEVNIYLGKVLMLDFHYNYIKNKYSDKVEMMLTDTDNFMHEIEAENVHGDFYKNKEILGFSYYLKG